ncbi:hypothetical protein F5I97DRAFT_2011196 [Phlebopus sp. FC_14]|nr:hypothetical protein F5I97DRAFT_2011196 [Phlebopus sp. FC_14]
MASQSFDSGQPLRLLMPTVRPPTPHVWILPSPPSPPTRSPRAKPTQGRLMRSRSGSATATTDTTGVGKSMATRRGEERRSMHGERWIGRKCRFEIVVERMELTGYQVYAVEKWIVERTRPVTVLTLMHDSVQITVTALSPMATMTYPEAVAEFKAAIQHLRKQDGARPKEVPQGTLMVTSLAHFRSDYTIVHIPDGDFLAVQERLYSNINLLRMGCSGRSAVTLEDPSEATKDRFKSMYFLSDGPPPTSVLRSKSHPRSHTRGYSHPATTLGISPTLPEDSAISISTSHQQNLMGLHHSNTSQSGTIGTSGTPRHPHFASYVLELVKLLQVALSICGMFPLLPPYAPGPMFDGLLCDVTVDGLRKWVVEIGESLIGFESTERIADPSVVAALLSFVLSTRNKLSALVQAVPKDPFLYPHEFLCTLSSHALTQLAGNSNSTHSTPLLPTLISSQLSAQSGYSSPWYGNSVISPAVSPLSSAPESVMFLYPLVTILNLFFSTPQTQPNPPIANDNSLSVPVTYLTFSLHSALVSAHDTKSRYPDSRRVHRVLLSKLDPTSDEDAMDEERKGLSGRVMGFVGRAHGAGGLGVPTADLGQFVRAVVGGRERGREREKEKNRLNRDGENVQEFGDGVAVDEKERVGGSLKALWGGKVEELARMRERAEARGSAHRSRKREILKERERDREKDKDKDRLTSSDVDETVMKNAGEDELAFGGAWSGRVQKKLEMWAGINRSKKSVDLTPVRSNVRTSSVVIPLSAQSSSSSHVYPTSEPKGREVPAVVVSSDKGEEDELLSSGQVSPISVSRMHNPFILSRSTDVSSANLVGNESEKRLDEFLARRERKQKQTRAHAQGEDPGGERRGIRDGGNYFAIGEEATWRSRVLADEIGELTKSESNSCGLGRRHTFHDLDSVRNISILPVDWMHIDVELCGQILVMRRREAHLDGVAKCLEYLTCTLSRLSDTLRASRDAHGPLITALTSPISSDNPHLGHSETPVLAAVHALPSLPPVAALEYEAAQLRVGEMWGNARAARRKVWELRNAVFGPVGLGSSSGMERGGGRGPRGKRRVPQWTLAGTDRLVDVHGRTESEAEEERLAAAGNSSRSFISDDESDGDVGIADVAGSGVTGLREGEAETEAERQGMMPMWLLRVFTSWGARWGFLRRGDGMGATREPSPSGDASPTGGGVPA